MNPNADECFLEGTAADIFLKIQRTWMNGG